MSPESAILVRETWTLLAPQADALADDFYARLFAASPDAAALFTHVDMAEQRRKFLLMLGGLIRLLDDPGLLVSESVPSGRRHVAYGARAEHYPLVGRALLDAMEHALGPAFGADARAAWSELYTLVSAVMRRAAERATPGAARVR